MTTFRYYMLSFLLATAYAAVGMDTSTKDIVVSAIKNNNIAQIQKLYERGLDINALDAEERSILHHAVMLGQHDIVKWILGKPGLSPAIKFKAHLIAQILCTKDPLNLINAQILTLLSDIVNDLPQDHLYLLLGYTINTISAIELSSHLSKLRAKPENLISTISICDNISIIGICENIVAKGLKNINHLHAIWHNTNKRGLLYSILINNINPKLLIQVCKHLTFSRRDFEAVLRKITQKVDWYNEQLFEGIIKGTNGDPYAGIIALDAINLQALKRNRTIRALRRCLITHMVLSKKLPAYIAWDIALQALQVEDTHYNYASLYKAALERDNNNNHNTQAAHSWCTIQ